MTATLQHNFFQRDDAAFPASSEITFQLKKLRVHEQIVANLDIAAAEGLSDEQLSAELGPFIDEIIADLNIDLSGGDRKRLKNEMPQEMFGIGPLEPLLADPTISDILVNHAHEIFVEKNGQLEETDIVFANDAHLMQVIQRIVAHVGRRIDEASPMVDARLKDGSRVNAIVPPLALDGPKLSIRRFGQMRFDLNALVTNNTMTIEMAQFLDAAVRARQSILISGGTGSGKTTILNSLSSCIPDDQRIVTIEDSAELVLQHRHVARLETRPANSEQSGEYSQRELVRNSLRMRPDRIIVGEVRGAEALDMLQAMNTGHEGSLTTIHANDTHDAISRLEMMVAMSGIELPIDVVRSYICSGISLLVHVSRLPGGARRMMKITELEKVESGYKFRDVFAFNRTGVSDEGIAQGHFSILKQPKCIDQFSEAGVLFDTQIFECNR